MGCGCIFPAKDRLDGKFSLHSAWSLEDLGPVLAWFLSQPMWSGASYLLSWALAFSAITWGGGGGKQWDRAEGPRNREWTALFCLLVRCSLMFCQRPVALGGQHWVGCPLPSNTPVQSPPSKFRLQSACCSQIQSHT